MVWRLVLDLHLPLTEIERWSLDDIREANALLDMRDDHDAALDAYQAEKLKETQKA